MRDGLNQDLQLKQNTDGEPHSALSLFSNTQKQLTSLASPRFDTQGKQETVKDNAMGEEEIADQSPENEGA